MTDQCFDLLRRGPYHARAMGDPLRDRRAADELAAKRQVVEFDAEIGEFERFFAAIEADLAALPPPERPAGAGRRPVAGRLRFREPADAGILAVLEGHIEARVTSVCQRCLDAFDWPLAAELRLGLVMHGDVPAAREGFELWELDSAVIRPIEIVDEALVMAMPLSPRHEDAVRCVEIESPGAGDDKIRPFAALRARMDADKPD